MRSVRRAGLRRYLREHSRGALLCGLADRQGAGALPGFAGISRDRERNYPRSAPGRRRTGRETHSPNPEVIADGADRETSIGSRFVKTRMVLGFLANPAAMSCGPAWAASSCSALAPSADPDPNYKNIVACLSQPDHAAHLTSGVFPVSRKIKMPGGRRFRERPKHVLKAADGEAAFKDNMIIELTGKNVVRDIAFVGDGHLKPGCCTTIVGITGSGSRIQNADLSDEDASHVSGGRNVRTAGLYFLGDPDSRDNLGGNLRIHGLNFGVIFRKGFLRARTTGSPAAISSIFPATPSVSRAAELPKATTRTKQASTANRVLCRFRAGDFTRSNNSEPS